MDYRKLELRLEHALPDGMSVFFKPVHREPTKPRVGLVAYADGTDWNPGSGEGLYVYKSTGWAALG